MPVSGSTVQTHVLQNIRNAVCRGESRDGTKENGDPQFVFDFSFVGDAFPEFGAPHGQSPRRITTRVATKNAEHSADTSAAECP